LGSSNGLPCDAVRWSMDDGAGATWLSMPCGLARIGPRELEGWIRDPRRGVAATLYDGSDGVRNRATIGYSAPRVSKAPDGKLWFVGPDGVGMIDFQRLAV